MGWGGNDHNGTQTKLNTRTDGLNCTWQKFQLFYHFKFTPVSFIGSCVMDFFFIKTEIY